MLKTLKDYVKNLKKEYDRCIYIDNELSENRSDNYYYHTRAELLLEVIDSLNDIIKENKGSV